MNAKTAFGRQAIRAAVRIHEHLVGPACQTGSITLPVAAWEYLFRTATRLDYIESRGWQAATQSLLLDMDFGIGRLERQLQALRQCLSARTTSQQVASAGEIAADLLALEDEFENVQLDLKRKAISVVTAPVLLEGVDLGAFQIALSWQRIGEGQPYYTYAKAPCHPDGRADITHPHVLDHQLCEGEGMAAIKAALATGRLLDFFVLVRQILGTYNPDSAHVSLSNWDGSMCCDGCGASMSDDDYSTCERCDERFCSDCSWICNGCSRTVCSGCSDFCAQCHERCCQSCLTTPEDTTRMLCNKCLEAHEKDRSDATKQETANQTPECPPRIPPEPVAALAADPVRVG